MRFLPTSFTHLPLVFPERGDCPGSKVIEGGTPIFNLNTHVYVCPSSGKPFGLALFGA